MMSDFVQTMKDWRRLCRTMEAENPGDACSHCPLLDLSLDNRGCDAIYADEFADNVDWRRLEEVVDIWAQANPEPVYPTWGDWLAEQGVVIKDKIGENKYMYNTLRKVSTPIPADIAQKLGIEPKEGT